MRLLPIVLLTLMAIPAAAAPVHIALKSAALITPSIDGFFQLAAVADLSGGDLAARIRFGAVSVGRAPLSGEVRRLTRGDLALKLRQAGCNPDSDVVLEGVGEVRVTTGSEPGLERPGYSEKAPPGLKTFVHTGCPVTILIQSGALCISAPGVARQSGGLGDCIRVHRDGVMIDLTVTVVDGQTVRLEI